MPTTEQFRTLVTAAAQAPSPDNMQAWAFANRETAIDVYLEPSRVLPTDVGAMFAWVGLGAAIENLVIAAGHTGLHPTTDHHALDHEPGGAHPAPTTIGGPPVTIQLAPGGSADPLADWIGRRRTNRGPYAKDPLDDDVQDALTATLEGVEAGVHWVTGAENLHRIAVMDAHSTYIRLEHPPLHDELFDILRFTRSETEEARYGLDFRTLGLPSALTGAARLLRHRTAVDLASRLGIGRLIARQLAARLRAAQAVCLITALRRTPTGYIEAGRAMERLWLAATARGLAVQPHGVLPQYLTKLDLEPDAFPPHFARSLRSQRDPFNRLFPDTQSFPAIVLRVGRPRTTPAQRSVRLPIDRLIRHDTEPTR